MQTEKKLTGYPSIDKPWLKYYTEEAINATMPECTMFKYLQDSNKEHLNDIALQYFNRKISFHEMFENIEKAAKAFASVGIKKDDIVVMATVTTPETICPGVTIGDNSIIGAGSVVTKDIPANVFACGVPCKVVREITEEDRIEG